MATELERVKNALKKIEDNKHSQPSGWRDQNNMLAGYLEACMHNTRAINPDSNLPIREVKETVIHGLYPLIPIKYERKRMETKQECIVRLAKNYVMKIESHPRLRNMSESAALAMEVKN